MQTKKWKTLVGMLALTMTAVLIAGSCSDNSDATDGSSSDFLGMDGGADATANDGSQTASSYLFVRIEDLSTVSGNQDGADIDAVELIKNGVSTWALTSELCVLPDGSSCENGAAATGESDAFCTEADRCISHLETPQDDPNTLITYSSLGGKGTDNPGYQVLKMSDKIENGDTLVVYEVGNCKVSATCDDTQTVNADAESIKVSVGTSSTGPWYEMLAGSDTTKHPKISITIADLP